MENVFVWAVLKEFNFPIGKEFENTPTRRIKGKFDSLVKIRKFRESIPDWLDRTGCDELGENRMDKRIVSFKRESKRYY